MLNQFSLENIKNNKIRTTIFFLLLIISLLIFGFSLQKYNMETANMEINDVVINYIEAMNKQNFDDVNKTLYPNHSSANDEYVLMLKAKANAIGLDSIRVRTIYPALIDNNIAIVAFQVSTNAIYNNEKVTLREIKTQILLKKKGQWYIAKPIDLTDYDKDYLNYFIDKYNDVLKSKIAPTDDNSLYNNEAFNKLSRERLIGGK